MSLIKKKFLANGAIAKLLNDVFIKGRNAADDADLDLIKIDSSNKIQIARDILPSTDNSQLLGTSVARFINLFSIKAQFSNVAGTNDLAVEDNKIHTRAQAGATNSTLLDIYTGDSDSGDTGNAQLGGGYTASGTGGNAVLYGGYCGNTGTPGNIQLFPGARDDLSLGGNVIIDKGGASGGEVSTNMPINMNSQKITSLANPTSAQDAATKSYVDSSAGVFNKESITLIAGDITNQYVDLDHPIKAFSLDLVVSGVYMEETVDYTISLIGGVGGVTRLTFAGDLATGGASELIAGDKLVIKYQY